MRVDGAIAHIPSNSHSGAVAHFKWAENEELKRKRFVECEWDGKGEYPGALKITRTGGEELTKKQVETIDRHYKNLAKAMSGDIDALGYFSDPMYRDVIDAVVWNEETTPETIAKILCDEVKIKAETALLLKDAKNDGNSNASSGDSAKNASSGHSAKNASSGDSATNEGKGINSVCVAAGVDSEAKVGSNGSFALTWHDGKRYRILVGYAGEDGIKADTWYKIEEGKLVEA